MGTESRITIIFKYTKQTASDFPSDAVLIAQFTCR